MRQRPLWARELHRAQHERAHRGVGMELNTRTRLKQWSEGHLHSPVRRQGPMWPAGAHGLSAIRSRSAALRHVIVTACVCHELYDACNLIKSGAEMALL